MHVPELDIYQSSEPATLFSSCFYEKPTSVHCDLFGKVSMHFCSNPSRLYSKQPTYFIAQRADFPRFLLSSLDMLAEDKGNVAWLTWQNIGQWGGDYWWRRTEAEKPPADMTACEMLHWDEGAEQPPLIGSMAASGIFGRATNCAQCLANRKGQQRVLQHIKDQHISVYTPTTDSSLHQREEVKSVGACVYLCVSVCKHSHVYAVCFLPLPFLEIKLKCYFSL